MPLLYSTTKLGVASSDAADFEGCTACSVPERARMRMDRADGSTGFVLSSSHVLISGPISTSSSPRDPRDGGLRAASGPARWPPRASSPSMASRAPTIHSNSRPSRPRPHDALRAPSSDGGSLRSAYATVAAIVSLERTMVDWALLSSSSTPKTSSQFSSAGGVDACECAWELLRERHEQATAERMDCSRRVTCVCMQGFRCKTSSS